MKSSIGAILLFVLCLGIFGQAGAQVVDPPYLGPFNISDLATSRTDAKVFLPKNYDGRKHWPMVILLHGFSGSAPQIDKYFGLSGHVTERGFILVTPSGMLNNWGYHFWNATDACCDFDKTAVDDAGYLDRLLNNLESKYHVDKSRIYITGHSNGGFMSHRLACDESDRIAAIASFAGPTFKDASLCKAKHPVSLLQIHAVDDDMVHFEGDAGFLNLKAYPGSQATVDEWVARNGCDPKPVVKAPLDITSSIVGLDTDVRSWQQCKAGTHVEFWTIRKHLVKHSTHSPDLRPEFATLLLDFLLAQQKN